MTRTSRRCKAERRAANSAGDPAASNGNSDRRDGFHGLFGLGFHARSLHAWYGTSAPRREVAVPMSDGVQLSATMIEPRSGYAVDRAPVIFVHGFGGERTEKGLFSSLAESLANAGCPVLLYDWRGIGRSQGSFSETTLEQHACDFAAVTNWFMANLSTERTKPWAVGFSLGAAIVVLGIQRRAASLQGAAFLSPAICPAEDMWPRYESLHHKAAAGTVIKPGTSVVLGRPILESLRCTNLCDELGRLSIPILLVHGEGDSRIPVRRSRTLHDRFKSTVDLTLFEHASHSFEPRQLHWTKLQTVVREYLTGTRANDSQPDQG